MKHLSSRPHNIDTQTTANLSDAEIAALPFLFQMLVNMALRLLAKCARSRSAKPRARLMVIFGALAYLHGGTREDKRAFLKRLFARHEEIQDHLQAVYMTWRQRKCWMWGGGFRAEGLAIFPARSGAARDLQSFDALIPD